MFKFTIRLVPFKRCYKHLQMKKQFLSSNSSNSNGNKKSSIGVTVSTILSLGVICSLGSGLYYQLYMLGLKELERTEAARPGMHQHYNKNQTP